VWEAPLRSLGHLLSNKVERSRAAVQPSRSMPPILLPMRFDVGRRISVSMHRACRSAFAPAFMPLRARHTRLTGQQQHATVGSCAVRGRTCLWRASISCSSRRCLRTRRAHARVETSQPSAAAISNKPNHQLCRAVRVPGSTHLLAMSGRIRWRG